MCARKDEVICFVWHYFWGRLFSFSLVMTSIRLWFCVSWTISRPEFFSCTKKQSCKLVFILFCISNVNIRTVHNSAFAHVIIKLDFYWRTAVFFHSFSCHMVTDSKTHIKTFSIWTWVMCENCLQKFNKFHPLLLWFIAWTTETALSKIPQRGRLRWKKLTF